LTTSRSFGQKDTTIIKHNDSIVSIPKATAILITKDLLKKDILEQEVAYLKADTSLLLKQIGAYKKDSVLNSIKQQANLSLIGSYNKSLMNCEEYAMKQNRKLRNSKTKTTISQILLIAVSIFAISKL
jgi:hypothetical protein